MPVSVKVSVSAQGLESVQQPAVEVSALRPAVVAAVRKQLSVEALPPPASAQPAVPGQLLVAEQAVVVASVLPMVVAAERVVPRFVAALL